MDAAMHAKVPSLIHSDTKKVFNIDRTLSIEYRRIFFNKELMTDDFGLKIPKHFLPSFFSQCCKANHLIDMVLICL